MRIVFVPVDPDLNPNFQKASFMLRLLAEHPEHRAIAYFDSDVVVTAGWAFFEDWSTRGVGLCMDMVSSVPPSTRGGWPGATSPRASGSTPVHSTTTATRASSSSLASTRTSCGSGSARSRRSWRTCQCRPEGDVKFGDVESPFHRSDQDAMAIAMMATSAPLSSWDRTG
jgi:hypothetical protein